MTDTAPLPDQGHPMPRHGRLLRLLVAMILASVVSVGICVWQVSRSDESIHALTHEQVVLDSLGNTTLYHHEMMTSAAQMFCLNGLPVWKERYEAAQRELGQDLINIRLMTPETFSPLNAVLEEASGELGRIEEECFQLARAEQRLQGLSLLAGDNYLKAKEHFNDSLMTLRQDLGDTSREQERAVRAALMWWERLLGGVLAVLVVMWLLCLRLVVGWQKRARLAATEQQRMERKLSEQGRMMNKIIEHLPVGLFVKSVADNYRWDIWNKKAEELFEMPAAKVLGTSDFEHFPQKEARFFRDIDEKVMREGRVIDVETEPVTSQRGTWLAHTIKVPIYNDMGQPTWLLGIIEDITARKQQADARLQAHAQELEAANARLQLARQEAETASSIKAAFLETMDSELRKPLKTIAEAADSLLRSPLTAEQGQQVRTLRQCTGLVVHTLNDIAAQRDEGDGDALGRSR